MEGTTSMSLSKHGCIWKFSEFLSKILKYCIRYWSVFLNIPIVISKRAVIRKTCWMYEKAGPLFIVRNWLIIRIQITRKWLLKFKQEYIFQYLASKHQMGVGPLTMIQLPLRWRMSDLPMLNEWQDQSSLHSCQTLGLRPSANGLTCATERDDELNPPTYKQVLFQPSPYEVQRLSSTRFWS